MTKKFNPEKLFKIHFDYPEGTRMHARISEKEIVTLHDVKTIHIVEFEQGSIKICVMDHCDEMIFFGSATLVY